MWHGVGAGVGVVQLAAVGAHVGPGVGTYPQSHTPQLPSYSRVVAHHGVVP